MKKIILLIGALFIFPLFASAQMRDTTELNYSPGTYLRIAKRDHNVAVITGLVGVAAYSLITIRSKDPVPGTIIGAVFGVISIGFNFSAWNNIGKAGIQMNKRKVGLQIRNSATSK